MCDRRQHCLGGVLHCSRESSLHSCSVCGNLGAELLKHCLSSQPEMENKQALFQGLVPHLLGVQESQVCLLGKHWMCSALLPTGAVWQAVTALSRRGALLPVLAQRFSHPPELPGPPRAVDGTGSPAQLEGTGRSQAGIHCWHSRTLGQERDSSFTDKGKAHCTSWTGLWRALSILSLLEVPTTLVAAKCPAE